MQNEILTYDYANQKDNKYMYIYIKRLFDIILSIIGLILSSPLFIIIPVLIKLEDNGNVFYKHKRVGKDGKTLYIYKFRSMVMNAEDKIQNFTKKQREEFEKNYKLDDDPRITKIGKFIRKTSLDELPQILNILKGEMSLIGPRPITKEELPKFGKGKDLLLSIKPGLTGLWACSGRSDVSYEERVFMELYYVSNCSLSLDIACFFKTVASVLKRKGAK